MDERLRKIIVGLALEGEFSYGRFNQTLFDLYSNPNLDGIRGFHDRLNNSMSRYDREVAIWLGLTLEQKPYYLDMKDLIVELQEMEYILYLMLQEVNDTSRKDLSDWMNYLANAAHSLDDGWYIDAKICMNLALESAMKGSIERLKQNITLADSINLLQMETLRRYKQIKELSFKLEIPEARLNVILEVQGMLIELMRRRHLKLFEGEIIEMVPPLLSRLSAALRYLMRPDVEVKKARDELVIASRIIEKWKERFSGDKTAEGIERLNQRITSLISAFK